MDDSKTEPSPPKKQKQKRVDPSSRARHEEEILPFHDRVPSNDELSNLPEVNDSDYDGDVKRNIVLCGKRKRRPIKKEGRI